MGVEAVERAARHAKVWRQQNAELASLEAIITHRSRPGELSGPLAQWLPEELRR
jgi:hypothetical protein